MVFMGDKFYQQPSKYTSGNPAAEQTKGRLQKRWMDNIEEDLIRAGITTYWKTYGRRRLTEEIAKDRERWREVVAAGRWTPGLT